MKQPIPVNSVTNICGAIGDVLRASAAWGQAEAAGDEQDAYIAAVSQTVAQLLTIITQREPTDAELLSVIGL